MESRHPIRPVTLAAASRVARDTWMYRLALAEPLPFVAGQFVNLQVPGARPRGERSYSVWSSPADAHTHLDLCIKLFEGGAASEYLRGSRVGDPMAVRGPFGVFTLAPDAAEVVFVATATGLAPFRSMLEVAVAEGDRRPFRLYFGVRSQEDLFALTDLERYARLLPDFAYTVCLSRAEPGWEGYRGRVTAAVAERHPAPTEHVYLCGNGAMIEETRALLKERGLDRKRIHVERYY